MSDHIPLPDDGSCILLAVRNAMGMTPVVVESLLLDEIADHDSGSLRDAMLELTPEFRRLLRAALRRRRTR